MTELHELQEPVLWTRLRELQETITPLDTELARIEGERMAALRDAATELSKGMIGRTVTATNISDYHDGDVLMAMNAHNAAQASAFAPHGLRTYPGARNNYFRSSPITYPTSITGEAVGFDLPEYSLVIKPESITRRLMVSRYWVRLIDESGNPLVQIN